MQKEYAIVIIIVIATVITPASDVFALLLVVLPMWILYEVSIMIVSKMYYSMEENKWEINISPRSVMKIRSTAILRWKTIR